MNVDVETFELLKEGVRRFVQDRLIPSENEVEELDDVPQEIIQDMKQIGLFGISIPEEFGGIGLNMMQECELVYELGHTALAFRSVVGTNIGIGSQGILIDGTLEQKNSIYQE